MTLDFNYIAALIISCCDEAKSLRSNNTGFFYQEVLGRLLDVCFLRSFDFESRRRKIDGILTFDIGYLIAAHCDSEIDTGSQKKTIPCLLDADRSRSKNTRKLEDVEKLCFVQNILMASQVIFSKLDMAHLLPSVEWRAPSEGKSLAQVIKDAKDSNGTLSEKQVRSWSKQIALGLQFLHQRLNISHGRLVPWNIFFRDGQTNAIKLGILEAESNRDQNSMAVMDPQSCTEFWQSLLNNAPEILDEDYSVDPRKGDVWSLGCLIYEMAALRHPFSAKSTIASINKIVNEDFDPLSHRFSCEMHMAVRLLLEKDGGKRLSINNLLMLPWFAEDRLTSDIN